MEKIKVTPEMRQHVLERIAREDIIPSKAVRFSALKKYLSVAACLVLLLAGVPSQPTLHLTHLQGGVDCNQCDFYSNLPLPAAATPFHYYLESAALRSSPLKILREQLRSFFAATMAEKKPHQEVLINQETINQQAERLHVGPICVHSCDLSIGVVISTDIFTAKGFANADFILLVTIEDLYHPAFHGLNVPPTVPHFCHGGGNILTYYLESAALRSSPLKILREQLRV